MRNVLAVLALSSAALGAHAAAFSFHYQMGTSGSVPQLISGDYGSAVQAGDTISYELDAANGYEWSGGTYFDTLVGVGPDGHTRTADYTWSFADNGVTVGSGSAASVSTGAVHFGALPPPPGLTFDQFFWTALVDTAFSGDVLTNYSFGVITNASYTQVAATPLPGALWLFGTGLLGFLGFRRFRLADSRRTALATT
jgi:hypothetical protein